MPEKDALSQEEMDALLGEEAVPEPEAKALPALTPSEISGLTQTLQNSAAAVSQAISQALNLPCTLANPQVKVVSTEGVLRDLPEESVVVEFKLQGDAEGPSCFIIPKKEATVMADVIMGSDGTSPPDEINELYMGALSEMSQKVITSLSQSLVSYLTKNISISAPTVNLVNFSEGPGEVRIMEEDSVVQVSYAFKVGDLFTTTLTQLLSFPLAKSLSAKATVTPTPTAPFPSTPAQQPTTAAVHPVQFAPLGEAAPSAAPSNITLLMDVPMSVSVELGRTQMSVKDILELSPGSVIELDKLAGEPVDLLVNGKLIAKGGVVVIEENFGIRITDIVSPEERLGKLK